VVRETAANVDEVTLLTVVRRHGVRRIAADAFLRFRYGDGFSHARALALLLCLAVVPFFIALTGLADEVGAEQGGRVIAYTALALSPGRSDALVRSLVMEDEGDTGEFALILGLISGVVAGTGAMAQIERGANRLYGVRRDRPALPKYARAVVLTVAAGLPAFSGFVMIVTGEAVGDALERVYGWGVWTERVWTVVHLPAALVMTMAAVVLLFRHAPRRRQPSVRWLLPGVVVATVLWIGVTGLLATYVNSGLSFNQIYGPLAAVMALLLWANASGIALLFGVACNAQLEACRTGDSRPSEPDLWDEDSAGHADRDGRGRRWSLIQMAHAVRRCARRLGGGRR
jgi:YihY family inner membrane protein